MKKTILSGVVTQFRGEGRRLGYPTANLTTATDLADGVYFGYANMGEFQHQPALIFIGVPTTVGDTERRVEAHLLDIPDQDYYGQKLSLSLEYFHRQNQTYASIEALQKVMHNDETIARNWFKRR